MPIDDSLLILFFAAVTGLVVGSFLNVVIYRLPLMLQARWKSDCQEHLGISDGDKDAGRSLTLSAPSSHCPDCGTRIRPWQNIPVISYLLLRGRCSNCRTRIPLRYPLVELLSGILITAVFWHFGLTPAGLGAAVLAWTLIALTFIDLEHQLLPDSITLPGIWLGLLINTGNIYTDPVSAIFGAVFGYFSLWLVFHLFRMITGKEGMGYGDFKLLALLGAWLGWQMLPQVVLVASLSGALVGIMMIILRKHQREIPIPFGPHLAIAGIIAMFWGESINSWYLQLLGMSHT